MREPVFILTDGSEIPFSHAPSFALKDVVANKVAASSECDDDFHKRYAAVLLTERGGL